MGCRGVEGAHIVLMVDGGNYAISFWNGAEFLKKMGINAKTKLKKIKDICYFEQKENSYQV